MPRVRTAFVPHDPRAPIAGAPIAGAPSGPLSGLAAAVKDMYDIEGYTTGGGNPQWLATHQPATRTCAAVRKILDAGATRFLAKYEFPLEELQPQDEAALNRLLESLLPQEVEESMEQAQKTVEDRMAAVIQAVPVIDPTLEVAAKSVLGKMTHELTTLHNKIIQAAKRRDETLRRQFTHARAQAYPGGPQDRTLGVAALLNEFGPGIIEQLLADLPTDARCHYLLAP